MYKLTADDEATFYSPVDIVAPERVSKSTEDRMFVVDSGASMQHAKQERFELRFGFSSGAKGCQC